MTQGPNIPLSLITIGGSAGPYDTLAAMASVSLGIGIESICLEGSSLVSARKKIALVLKVPNG